VKKEKQEQLEKEKILAQLTERERRRYLMHLDRGDFESGEEGAESHKDGNNNHNGSGEDDGKEEESSDEDAKGNNKESATKVKKETVDEKEPKDQTAIETKSSVSSLSANSSTLKDDQPNISVKKPSAITNNNKNEDTSDAEDEDSSYYDDVDDDKSDGTDNGDGDEDDSQDVDDSDDNGDEEDDEEDDKGQRKEEVVDVTKPIPGRRIVRGRRNLNLPQTQRNTVRLDSSDDEIEEIIDDGDENNEDDPFLAALKTAEEKKKALLNVSPTKEVTVDLTSKYQPKPSEFFANQHEDDVEALDEELERKLTLGGKDKDDVLQEEDSDGDIIVKSFVFKALQ
jgi:hypothetical protein